MLSIYIVQTTNKQNILHDSFLFIDQSMQQEPEQQTEQQTG